MIGETYLERGKPVKVLAAWRGRTLCRHAEQGTICEHITYPHFHLEHVDLCLHIELKRTAPRNVLIERADGTLVVRPFRGLRKVRS